MMMMMMMMVIKKGGAVKGGAKVDNAEEGLGDVSATVASPFARGVTSGRARSDRSALRQNITIRSGTRQKTDAVLSGAHRLLGVVERETGRLRPSLRDLPGTCDVKSERNILGCVAKSLLVFGTIDKCQSIGRGSAGAEPVLVCLNGGLDRRVEGREVNPTFAGLRCDRDTIHTKPRTHCLHRLGE